MFERELSDARQTRAARNESLYRAVNEQLKAVNQAFSELVKASDSGPAGEFVCECADLTCDERIELFLEEYERVRQVPTHFVVRPGHIVTEVERVVERNERFVVVSKFRVAG